MLASRHPQPTKPTAPRAALTVVLSLALSLAAAGTLGAQQDGSDTARAAEVASLVDLAATEYADAVADGEVVNRMEYEEATAFTEEAANLFGLLRSESETEADAAIAAGLDSLATIVAAKGPVEDFRAVAREISAELARARGAVSVPEPSRRPDAARGAALYRQACAACHGTRGEGDGWAADGMQPPPADLTSRLRWQEGTPARDFQVTYYGIPETAMPASRDWLTPETAWDLVAYVRTLPFTAAEAAEGKALAHVRDDDEANPLAGRLRRWSSPAEVARVTDAALAERVRARWDEGRGAEGDSLGAERARAVVAYLRTLMGTSAEGVPEEDRSASVVASLERADSLATTAVRLAGSGEADRARSTALRSYMAFEAVEPDLRARFPELVREGEAAFGDLRAAVERGGEARAALEPLRDVLQRAEERVGSPASDWNLATQSFFIILREGFEAILILGAILAFLMKTGNHERKRDVYVGTGAALAASVATAFVLQEVLAAAPASRELLEGATMLLAVVVLFSVSYWLLSKLEHAKWEAYLRSKMKSALGAGSGLALAGVAFLAVYREGFETVIFYQALLGFAEGGVFPVAAGFAIGCVALAVIYLLFTRYGVKIPMRPFFAVTSGVLYYMAIVFAGSGVRELQEAGVVGTTGVEGIPTVPLVGLYPTAETLAAQGLLVALLAAALWYTFGASAGGGEPEGRGSGATAGSA